MKVEVETVHPSGLSPEDIAAWRALAAAEPAFAHPLLGPDFARAVGEVRLDARVAVFRRRGAAIGFLPHHRRPGGLARPLGAPLSDYHALVAAPDSGLEGGRALAAAGLAAFRYTGLVDPHGAFTASTAAAAPGWTVALDGPAEACLERLRAASPKRAKNWRRLHQKLEREVGPVRFEASDDPAVYEQLLSWKREQLVRGGLADFMRPDWTRRLLDNLSRKRGEFAGLTLAMWAGDTLAAGHFGVRQGGWYHSWISSTHPDLGSCSPGQTFLIQAITAMPSLGLTTYDLGQGSDHYKQHYAARTVMAGEGTAAAPTSAGRLAAGREQAWTLAGARRPGLVASLRRRLDIIAASELSAVGRVRGFVDALAAQPRRRLALESD